MAAPCFAIPLWSVGVLLYMDLSQGNSSSCGLSYMVYKTARIISCYIQHIRTGLLPQGKKSQMVRGIRQLFQQFWGNQGKENQGRLNIHSPGFGEGQLWNVRLPACLASRQGGNTVLSANTRGKCSTKIQALGVQAECKMRCSHSLQIHKRCRLNPKLNSIGLHEGTFVIFHIRAYLNSTVSSAALAGCL